MMSFTMISAHGSRNQISPSNTLDTKKDDGTNTVSRIMCVQAYWPNWYMYMPRLRDSTKEMKPGGAGRGGVGRGGGQSGAGAAQRRRAAAAGRRRRRARRLQTSGLYRPDARPPAP
jgi:hypothetical protein